MRVAFDVKGTLAGPEKIEKFFKWFQSKGCEMVIWSNLYSYTTEIKEKLGLEAETMSKKGTFDCEDEMEYMDIAIEDDHSQTWLAAKKIIFVDEVPENEEDFEKLYGGLFV